MSFKVLIGCEESQTVTIEFRKLGIEAFSCDLLPCSGNHPEWHLQQDIFEVIQQKKWNLMICHPPCTYLTTTANRAFVNSPERWKARLDAMLFVHRLLNVDIDKICLENPVGVISTHIRQPEQYIQPYDFGHPVSKKTGLWLKNLPPLEKTKTVEVEWVVPPSGKRMSKLHANNPSTNCPENAKLRSRTFQGIAKAMSLQWSKLL